jgi:hypothetical protein
LLQVRPGLFVGPDFRPSFQNVLGFNKQLGFGGQWKCFSSIDWSAWRIDPDLAFSRIVRAELADRIASGPVYSSARISGLHSGMS